MLIVRKFGTVRLESHGIVWASATVGYCPICKRDIAYDYRGALPERLKGNLRLVGLEDGASPIACQRCRQKTEKIWRLGS